MIKPVSHLWTHFIFQQCRCPATAVDNSGNFSHPHLLGINYGYIIDDRGAADGKSHFQLGIGGLYLRNKNFIGNNFSGVITDIQQFPGSR